MLHLGNFINPQKHQPIEAQICNKPDFAAFSECPD
jgi:hypothetical protein